jgi:hypothetical protein
MAIGAFFFLFFPPLLWGEFLQPGEGKRQKKQRRMQKLQRDFFGGKKWVQIDSL